MIKFIEELIEELKELTNKFVEKLGGFFMYLFVGNMDLAPKDIKFEQDNPPYTPPYKDYEDRRPTLTMKDISVDIPEVKLINPHTPSNYPSHPINFKF